MVAAGAHEHAEHGLDLASREPHRFSAFTPVSNDLALALRVADAEPMLTLVRGDLANERHATNDDLQKVAVEHVDHGAKNRERAGGGVVDHGVETSSPCPT